VEAVTAAVVPLEGDVPDADADFLRSDERVDLESRLARLDDREREVVFLRFFADLTQDEIAKRVGVSQMHVSRILRGALETMRTSVG
jgi:RNA polymerase sigma-B factor